MRVGAKRTGAGDFDDPINQTRGSDFIWQSRGLRFRSGMPEPQPGLRNAAHEIRPEDFKISVLPGVLVLTANPSALDHAERVPRQYAKVLAEYDAVESG